MTQNNSGCCPFENKPEMQKYFDSLPAYVQENIMQTGVEITSLDQLHKCADNLLKK
mgnify:CR=1 FL=1